MSKKRLIVIDRDYLPLILKWHNSHPEENVKIIDREEYISQLSFGYERDPLPFLIRYFYDKGDKTVDYNNANKIMQLLQVSNFKINPKLLDAFEALDEEEYIKRNPYGRKFIENHDVELLELHEDVELEKLSVRNSIPFKKITLEELGISEKNNKEHHPPIISFGDKFSQYMMIASLMRKECLEHPDKKNALTLHIKDDFDIFYSKEIFNEFGLKERGKISNSLLSDEEISRHLRYFHANKSFIFPDDNKTENRVFLDKTISKYHLTEYTDDFEFAYSILLEILNSINEITYFGEAGIQVTKSFSFDPDKKIYISDFIDGVFPLSYQDNGMFPDAELERIDANTSYVRSKLDRRKKVNYLRYMDIALLSRVERHLEDAIYDSPLMSMFSDKYDEMNLDGSYTDEALRLLTSNKMEKLRIHPNVGVYNSYDNSFNGISNRQVFDYTQWSVSKLTDYSSCPYAFYLKKMIPTKTQDAHHMAHGELVHKVYEDALQIDYDFDKSLKEGLEAHKSKYAQAGLEYTPSDEVFSRIVAHHIKTFVNIYREQLLSRYGKEEGYMAELKAHPNDAEMPVKFVLKDEDGTEYPFEGRIDRIIHNGSQGKGYYTIIDYKTGDDEFNINEVPLGKNLQLPLYALATIENPAECHQYTNGYDFAGFGIEHPYPKTFSKIKIDNELSGDGVKGFYRVRGLFLEDEKYLGDFLNKKNDGSIDKRSNKTDFFLSPNFFKSLEENIEDNLMPKIAKDMRYNFSDMLNDAVSASIDNIKGIQENKFPIRPFGGDACTYCEYRDICYKRKGDEMDIMKSLREKFKKKGDE